MGAAALLAASSSAAWRVLIEAGILDHVLLLIDAVLANRLHNVVLRKAIEEPSIAAADDGLAGCLAVARPGAHANESRGAQSAWSPISFCDS